MSGRATEMAAETEHGAAHTKKADASDGDAAKKRPAAEGDAGGRELFAHKLKARLRRRAESPDGESKHTTPDAAHGHADAAAKQRTGKGADEAERKMVADQIAQLVERAKHEVETIMGSLRAEIDAQIGARGDPARLTALVDGAATQSHAALAATRAKVRQYVAGLPGKLLPVGKAVAAQMADTIAELDEVIEEERQTLLSRLTNKDR